MSEKIARHLATISPGSSLKIKNNSTAPMLVFISPPTEFPDFEAIGTTSMGDSRLDIRRGE